MWRTNLMEPDLLPVIASRTQDSAVGSLNAKATRFYRDDGCELGSYPKAALVSEHQLDHWVALSDGEVALLRRNGEPIWVRDVDTQRDWGLRQALVDASGNIFAPQRGGLLSLTPEGEQRFAAHIADSVPDVLAFVGDGLVGLVSESRLIIIR